MFADAAQSAMEAHDAKLDWRTESPEVAVWQLLASLRALCRHKGLDADAIWAEVIEAEPKFRN